jgi:hypothetical protein
MRGSDDLGCTIWNAVTFVAAVVILLWLLERL